MIYLNNKNSNIRRIDELGRIVIPKDIRKKLYLKDNEPLEIYIDNDSIVVKKYSALPDMKEFITDLIDIGNRITGNKYIVTSRTNVITSNKKEIENQFISEQLESYCLNGSEIRNIKVELCVTPSYRINAFVILVPILIEGDRSGVLIEYNEEKKIDNDYIIKLFKSLIEKKYNNC